MSLEYNCSSFVATFDSDLSYDGRHKKDATE